MTAGISPSGFPTVIITVGLEYFDWCMYIAYFKKTAHHIGMGEK